MKYEFLSLDLEDGYQVLYLTEDKVEKKWHIQLPISADSLFWTEEGKTSLDDGERVYELTDEKFDFLEEVEEQFFSKFEERSCALAAIATENDKILGFAYTGYVFNNFEKTRVCVAFSKKSCYFLQEHFNVFMEPSKKSLPKNITAEYVVNSELSQMLEEFLEEESLAWKTLDKDETRDQLLKLAEKFTEKIFKIENFTEKDRKSYATIDYFWHFGVFKVVNDFLDENYTFE